MLRRILPFFVFLVSVTANASDGLLTLHQSAQEDYTLTVVSGAGGLVTGKQHLSIVLEPRELKTVPESQLSLRLEHPKETLLINLVPSSSPFVYTSNANLEHAGRWQARLYLKSSNETINIEFSFRLYKPLHLTALVIGSSLVILGLLSLIVYKPNLAKIGKSSYPRSTASKA